jgi:hypothetical protein
MKTQMKRENGSAQEIMDLASWMTTSLIQAMYQLDCLLLLLDKSILLNSFMMVSSILVQR